MNKIKNLLFFFAFVSIVGWGPFYLSVNHSSRDGLIHSSDWLEQETQIISSQANNLSPEAIKAGVTAYQKARKKGLDNKEMLTIIDYSKSSRDRRLLVVDMKNQKVLFNTWVAHGKNSGGENATSFSNDRSSLKSSLGVFVTSDVHNGKHGQALRIQGLEPGINDNAYRRDIEFHGAQYVGEDFARSHGMVGRSWGCMAVDQNTIKPLINTIRGKTVVVAYFPDQHWLNRSTFL